MAREIEATPVLKGKGAERFIQGLQSSKKQSEPNLDVKKITCAAKQRYAALHEKKHS